MKPSLQAKLRAHRLAWLTSLLAVAAPGRAAESWVDDRLPVRDGRVAWFDTARQNAAREAAQLAPLSSGSPADYMLDGSGERRHLTQQVASFRPIFHQSGSHSWLSFDGTDGFQIGRASGRER